MLVSRQVVLIPTDVQRELFIKFSNVARFAYNFCKYTSEIYFSATGESLSLNDLQKQFTIIKQTEAYSFLKEVNAQVPKYAARDFDKARAASFRKYGHGFATNFKSKRFEIPRFAVEKYSFYKCSGKEISLTSIGIVRTSRRLPRTKDLKNLRVKFDGFNWILTYTVEVKKVENKILTEEVIGIDDGLSDLAVCSNGLKFESLRKTSKYKKYESMKENAARKMSKRYVKGKVQSKNYQKAKLEHLRYSRKLSNMRQTYNHQVSRKTLSSMPKAVVVEDKSLNFMIKNPKQAKAVMSQGIGQLMGYIKYKAENQGTIFYKAPKGFASSKICHCCGYKYNDEDYEIPWGLNVRAWVCVSCGVIHDRDFNASKNLEFCFVDTKQKYKER